MAKPTDKVAKGSVTKNSVQEDSAVEMKVIMRDKMEIMHHLFKGQVAKALKSDPFGPVKIREIEHVHFFHSHNSHGVSQKMCHPVANHVHEFTWEVAKDGSLVAKCGPPLRKKVRPGPGGVSRVTYEPIKVKNQDNFDGAPDFYTDNHRHEMVYMGSDKISAEKIKAIQENNARKVGPPMGIQVTDDVKVPDGYSVVDTDAARTQE